MNFWPQPQNMVVAVGPGGTIIDIRTPGQYERWHGQGGTGRDGLRCLDCNRTVHPRRLQSDTPRQRDILAHAKREDGVDADAECATARTQRRGPGWKRALVEGLARQLVDAGHAVKIAPELQQGNADLAVRAGGATTFICVELQNLPYEKAVENDSALRKNRNVGPVSTLWLTFGCDWVDQHLPALGFRFSETAPRWSRDPLDVGGLFPVVDAGMLESQADGRLVQPALHARTLVAAVRSCLAARHARLPYDHQHAGWAHESKWAKHIIRTYGRLQNEERARANVERALTQAQRDLATAQQAAVQHEREQEQLRASLARALGAAAAAESHAERVERERQSAEAWIRDVEACRSSSWIARLALRRVVKR